MVKLSLCLFCLYLIGKSGKSLEDENCELKGCKCKEKDSTGYNPRSLVAKP